MKSYVTDIGPDEAKMFLEGNTGNRVLDKRTVAKYAREMKEGRWKTNGATISIYDDGKSILLLNGQHRLLAVIESGVTITVVIVEEDSPDVMPTLDVGKTRPTAQILAMHGIANSVPFAAIAKANIYLKEIPDLAWDRSSIRQVTPAEIIKWDTERDRERVYHAIHLYQEARRTLFATNTWYACLAYQVMTESPTSSRWLEFHHPYVTGLHLGDGSPIAALRNYTANRATLRGEASTFDRQAHLGIAMRAWNDWLAGREVRHYRFTRKSLPMPTLK